MQCTKFDFGWALPQTLLGSLCSLHLLAGFKERGGKGRRKGDGRIKGEVGPITFQTKVTQG